MLYLVSQSSLKKDFITPSSCLPPPNEVIGSLQRQVEAARGLFAKSDDGAGLSYLCHDGNEIASWSYYRDPKCQFGLVLTREPRTSQELPMATQLLEAALKGDSRHLRTLVTFYRYTASNKAKIWSMLIRALQEEIVSRQHVQAALQLSTWLQSEDAKDLMLNSLHERVSEMSLAYALHSRMQSTSARMSTFLDGDDVNFCTRLARAGLALTTRVNHPELQRSSQHMLKSVNKSSDLASYSRDGTFDLEEKCKACGSSVAFQTSNMLIAKCQKGHIWSEYKLLEALSLLLTLFVSVLKNDALPLSPSSPRSRTGYAQSAPVRPCSPCKPPAICRGFSSSRFHRATSATGPSSFDERHHVVIMY